MQRDTQTTEERQKTTVADLLQMAEMPLPVQDWLRKFADGRTLPYADRIIFDAYYNDSEIFVSALADHLVTNNPLPEAAREYVQEYLYRLEEQHELHIWNTPEIARAFLGVALCLSHEAPPLGDDFGTAAAKTALSRLCTRRELMEFYERHGIEDDYKGRDDLAGSVPIEKTDSHYAMKAARILADPRTPADVSDKLESTIADMSNATSVSVYHPALVERALTLMFEAKTKGRSKRIKQARQLLHEHLDGLPDIGEEEKGKP
jgi:hypothetical protein